MSNSNQSDDISETINNPTNQEPISDSIESNTIEENEIETQIQKLEAENEALKDKYLRLFSEFDNFKRRTAKERIELFKTANQDVLKALLPVLDDFDRAKKAVETNNEIEALKSGLDLVYHKFYNTLEQQGLKTYISINEPFDADLHEAITKIPAPSEDLKGKVVDELEKGFMLNDKVIRFAKVVIGE